MATGMAIMGFGGGAMIGAPLADLLMKHFATPTSVGVWRDLPDAGGDLFRLHDGRRLRATACRRRAGSRKAGRRRPTQSNNAMITDRHVHRRARSWKTPQFWLLWGVLCLNVTAGIGVIGMASPMLQEVFGGKLIGIDVALQRARRGDQKRADRRHRRRLHRPAVAVQHRRPFRLGVVLRLPRPQGDLLRLLRCSASLLYASIAVARQRRAAWRCSSAVFCIILSMYGGGFATIPGLSGRHVRHADGRRHPRPAAHGLVDRRHAGPGAGQLHPRIPDRARRARGAGLRHDDVHPRRLAGAGLVCNLLVSRSPRSTS